MTRPRKPPPPPPPKKSKAEWARECADKWFPIIVRYVGILLLLYAALIDQGATPGLMPVAVGLIAFKTILGNGKNGAVKKEEP